LALVTLTSTLASSSSSNLTLSTSLTPSATPATPQNTAEALVEQWSVVAIISRKQYHEDSNVLLWQTKWSTGMCLTCLLSCVFYSHHICYVSKMDFEF
jgi:hypothetical protein